MSARGLILAAIRSGEGKTVLASGILAALRRRGIAVSSAKSGPDYIDPAFHAAASGRPSFNLDSWAMPPDVLDRSLQRAAKGADIVLVEGALGLFDGIAGPQGRRGATSDLAARYRLPVLVVVDVSGQSQTVAAVLRGLMMHDPLVTIAGVILNRVGSDRHRTLIEEAIRAIDLPVLGALPRSAPLALPERHLGLVQAGEQEGLAERIDAFAATIEAHCDIGAIADLARPIAWPAGPPVPAAPPLPPPLLPPGRRIALASDAAFSFLYPHVVEGWREAGATIVPFSPLADEAPPEDCDACWLPGGYPELHAGRIASAERFLSGLRRFATERPVHGECGGHMVLGRFLVDADGGRHAMAGLLGHSTSFADRRLHLGYRSAVLTGDGALGAAGTTVRGHEFHYSSLVESGQDEPFAEFCDARGVALGPEGGRRGLVSGSYFHAMAALPAAEGPRKPAPHRRLFPWEDRAPI